MAFQDTAFQDPGFQIAEGAAPADVLALSPTDSAEADSVARLVFVARAKPTATGEVHGQVRLVFRASPLPSATAEAAGVSTLRGVVALLSTASAEDAGSALLREIVTLALGVTLSDESAGMPLVADAPVAAVPTTRTGGGWIFGRPWSAKEQAEFARRLQERPRLEKERPPKPLTLALYPTPSAEESGIPLVLPLSPPQVRPKKRKPQIDLMRERRQREEEELLLLV